MSIARSPLACLLGLTLLLSACSGDINAPSASDDATPPVIDDPAAGDGDTTDDNPPGDDATLRLDAARSTLALLEGGDTVSVELRIERDGAEDTPVTLTAGVPSPEHVDALDWRLDTTTLGAGETRATLSVTLAIGARPLLPHQRYLEIMASDDRGTSDTVTLTLDIQPTARPDVYLLVGQSNMVGYSELDARQIGAGEPDAPDARIRQLNVTGNDRQNFADAAAFSDPDRVAVAEPRFTEALDPLHDGYGGERGKSGTYIGLGLSFAKRALSDTTADIILVPAAWSDTGFCKRDTNIVPGIGWNATAPEHDALSGTLLFDRAVLRTNLALAETGGILRGILWHQGEADSDDVECAIRYRENLHSMVRALRSRIDADVRGAAFRGPDAHLPFVAGTMSKGDGYADFGDLKLIVDGVHRSLADELSHAAVVNNDDLVPPDYPCGSGGCIHFGAAAYREMGHRYYLALQNILTR